MHEIAEKFVAINKKNLGNMTCDEIKNSACRIFEQTLEDDDFYALKLPKNYFLLTLLKEEALRFCKFLNDEQSVCEFKPIYVEKYFGPNSDFVPLELDIENKKYIISGIVDRIDETESEYRIIDYKSGSTTNKNGAEKLFYGTKIQLFVYAYAIKNNMDKKFFGAFYLPINNDIKQNAQTQYSLSGFFENDVCMAIACDKDLPNAKKSNLINVTLLTNKKEGEIKLRAKKNILSTDELDSYLQYSLQLVKQTITDIKSGYIDCSPFGENACKYCSYKDFCKFAKNERVRRTEKYDVSAKTINNLVKGGQNG